MINFNIDLEDANYPVHISMDFISDLTALLLEKTKTVSCYCIVDEFVLEKYDLYQKIKSISDRAYIFRVASGKTSKSMQTALKIFQDLNEKNISRDSTIVAIGGGVVGDMAGYIASCWYRGTDLVHFPTTLLAAVDSCVGGKTAINFRDTVNAIGTYHHPSAIYIDAKLLTELPPREIASGFGEIIKYSLLAGGEIAQILEQTDNKSAEALARLVGLCLKEKERFVRGDVKESNARLFLNFGHTIGHAIEFSTTYEGYETLRHGEAVALGMLAVLRISVSLGILDESHLINLKMLLIKYNLPINYDANLLNISSEALSQKVVDLTFKDKKRKQDYLRLILLKDTGAPIHYKTSDRELINIGVKEVIT